MINATRIAAAADQSTVVVVVVAGVKSIEDPELSMKISATTFDCSSGCNPRRRTPDHYTPAAAVAAAPAAAADRSTSLVVAVTVAVAVAVAIFLLLMLLIRNYDKSINRHINHQSSSADAADQFFAVSPSNAKRIGVLPLLRTALATLCVWDCP